MGCDEVKTVENEEEVLKKIYKGVLEPQEDDFKFNDILIKTQEDLDDRLRFFIATKVPKGDNKELVPNTKDDILTQSININFDENYIIALCGINKVLRVEAIEGNYVIYHDNNPVSKTQYIALIVKRLDNNPRFILSPPKKHS